MIDLNAWREYFSWFLGVVVSLFGWAINRELKQRDEDRATIQHLKEDVAVLKSMAERRQGERRDRDDDDYRGPNRRHGDRRS